MSLGLYRLDFYMVCLDLQLYPYEDSVCSTGFFLPNKSEESLSETSCMLLYHQRNNEGSHMESFPIIYKSFHV
jgi:hypothetical protein